MATNNGFCMICVLAILLVILKSNTSTAEVNNGNISKVLNLNPLNELDGFSNKWNETDAYFNKNVYMKFALEIVGQNYGPASNRSNEGLIDRSDEAKYIEIVNLIYKYYRIGTFVILRIIFGAVLEVANVKAALKRPIGIGIAISCNFMFIPLLSYGHGLQLRVRDRYVFFWNGDNADKEYYEIRPVLNFMIILSNCWTKSLGGNIELSLVISVVTAVLSTVIQSRWLYSLGERIFNAERSNDLVKIDLNAYYILSTLCYSLVPLFVGFLMQYFSPKTKQYAIKALKYIAPIYICSIFVIIIGPLFGWGVLVLLAFRGFELAYIVAFFLPIFGYIVGLFLAFLFRQKYSDCLAIAAESTIHNIVLVMTFLPMGAHYLVDICRQKNKSESKNETQIEDLSESVLANTIYPNLGADLKRDHD